MKKIAIRFVVYGFLAILVIVLFSPRRIMNPPRVVDAANLKGVFEACLRYADKHDGQFPSNLRVLVDEKGLDPKLLISPFDARKAHTSILEPELRAKMLAKRREGSFLHMANQKITEVERLLSFISMVILDALRTRPV